MWWCEIGFFWSIYRGNSPCVTGSDGDPSHHERGTAWSYNACSSVPAPSPDGREVLWNSPKAKGIGTLSFEQSAQRGMQHVQVSGSSSTRKTQISLPETRAFYECMYSRVSQISSFVKKLMSSRVICFSEALQVQWYHFQELTCSTPCALAPKLWNFHGEPKNSFPYPFIFWS